MKHISWAIAISILSFSLYAEQDLEYDSKTNLVIANGFEETRANCTVCHSAKVITASKLSRDAWTETIRWMQDTQNLWPLGENKSVIIDYLQTYYGQDSQRVIIRRGNLTANLMPK